ncbi:MAG: response regulator [Archangiaceae bacterium]|nr:response regulator [Archangiaceae bacterium]
MRRILVVDDEIQVAKALRRLLRKEFEVETAESGAQALELLAQKQFDLVLSDFRMPEMNGAELLAEVRTRQPMALRLMLSGFADLESVLASVNEGEVCRFLKKPWDDVELVATLQRLLASHEMLMKLYNPFRHLQPGATAATAHSDENVRVSVRMTQTSFDRDAAIGLIRRFLGAIAESELALVGGLLQQHAGKLSFVAEVGGDQQLTLELPTAAAKAKGSPAGEVG